MSSSSCSWVTRKLNGPVPAPRQGHAAAVVDKKVYIFGGSSGSGFGGQHSDSTSDPVYLNDLFLLKVGLQVTWERLQQLGDIPCARDGHTLSAIGSVLYLFGGSNYPESEECLEGLYAYDIGTMSWELCPTQGRQPKFLGHSAAVVGDTLYMFGGIHRGIASDTLCMLNTGNLTWTPLKASGKPPPPRCDHACTVIGEKFFIMGGNGGEKLWYNDLHVFDTVTLRWEAVNAQGHLPRARSLHTICSHHGKDIYLFGGSNDKAKVPTPFDDVHKFSMSKLKWKKLQCSGSGPERRLGHAAVFVYGQLIIFGGMNDQKDFNDVCVLQTRFALKHLPSDIAGTDLVSSPSSCSDISGPLSTYELSIPVPAPYRPIFPAVVEPVKPQDFGDVKASFVKRIEDLFDEISSKFTELETQREALKNAAEAFQEERKAHMELFEEQQKELEEMIEKHKKQNEEWLNARKVELNEERKRLELEKRQLEEDRENLRQEREGFNQKIEAIEKLGSGASLLMNGSD